MSPLSSAPGTWRPQAKAGVIVWVHGPQPMLLDSAEELRQRFERSPESALAARSADPAGPEPGPGEAGRPQIRPLDSAAGRAGRRPRATVQRVEHGALPAWNLPATAGNQPPRATLRQAPRPRCTWRACGPRDEVARLCAARHFTEATQLAARYQLVTPVSGAVVLETQAQYQRAGLEPVPPESVPTVPEPSAGILLLLGLLLLAARRRTGWAPMPRW